MDKRVQIILQNGRVIGKVRPNNNNPDSLCIQVVGAIKIINPNVPKGVQAVIYSCEKPQSQYTFDLTLLPNHQKSIIEIQFHGIPWSHRFSFNGRTRVSLNRA